MNTYRTIQAGPREDRIRTHRGYGDACDYAMEGLRSGAAFVVIVDQTDNDRLCTVFRVTDYDGTFWNFEKIDTEAPTDGRETA